MAWQDLPLPLDEDTITDDILTGLTDRIDGWEPNEGDPAVALAEEFAHQLAITNQLTIAATQLSAAGIATTFGLSPVQAVTAVLPAVTLTMQLPPSAGTGPFTQPMLAPAGFMIAVDDVPFVISENVAQDVDFTQVTTGPQTGYWQGTFSTDFTAVNAGSSSNVGTIGESATIRTSSATIIAATLTAAASGGEDEETLLAFLNRFTAWVSTIRPGGVRATDIEKLAASVPGVERALALDLYDPANPGTPAERTVTVIPADADGQPLDTDVKTALSAELESIREVNFIFHVIDPTYTNVAIVVQVVAEAGVSHASLNAAITTAVTAAISPANWGTVDGDPTTWMERTTIRVLDIALAVSAVNGIASITTITINGGTSDVTLTGPGALPAAVAAAGSTVSVAVT